jgi:hypothetical protein
MTKTKEMQLVGKYVKSADPDTAEMLKREDGITTLKGIGEYVLGCDPERFDRIIEDHLADEAEEQRALDAYVDADKWTTSGSSNYQRWRKTELWLHASGRKSAALTQELLVLDQICGLDFDTEYAIWLDSKRGKWCVGRIDSLRFSLGVDPQYEAELKADYSFDTRGQAEHLVLNVALRAGATS